MSAARTKGQVSRKTDSRPVNMSLEPANASTGDTGGPVHSPHLRQRPSLDIGQTDQAVGHWWSGQAIMPTRLKLERCKRAGWLVVLGTTARV